MFQKAGDEYVKLRKSTSQSASPMKRCHQSIGTHDHGALGQLVVVLFNSFEIVPRRISLADGSRGEIHHLVTVTAYVSVKFCHPKVCPISADHCKHMSKGVRPYNGSESLS